MGGPHPKGKGDGRPNDERQGITGRNGTRGTNVRGSRTAEKGGDVMSPTGHKDIRQTMIYLHIVELTGLGIRSPLDQLDPDE